MPRNTSVHNLSHGTIARQANQNTTCNTVDIELHISHIHIITNKNCKYQCFIFFA